MEAVSRGALTRVECTHMRLQVSHHVGGEPGRAGQCDVLVQSEA